MSVYGSNGPVGSHDTPNTRAPVLIVGRKGSYGKVHYSSEPVFAIDTTYFIDRTATRADTRWLYYVLSSIGLDQLSNDVGVPGLSREKGLRATCCLGIHRAATGDADFLDAETARIDAVIAKKLKLRDLLHENRRARIETRLASLKGPKVPIGRFVTSLTQGVSPQAGGRPAEPGERGLLKLSAIKNGEFHPSENKVLDPGVAERGLTASKGDLLVSRSNTPAYVGDVCYVPKDFPKLVICDLIYRIRLDSRLLPEFAVLYLSSDEPRGLLASMARGTSQSMVKLRGEDIRSVPVPVPDLSEQQEVISEARALSTSWHRVNRRLIHQLALLQEHRQALITAAVTGELDIPGVA